MRKRLSNNKSISFLKNKDNQVFYSETAIANELAKHLFDSTKFNSQATSLEQTNSHNKMNKFFINDFQIYKKLCKRQSKNNTSPDQIPFILLKNCAKSLTQPIANLFRMSLSRGELPKIWKKALIIPIHKKSDKSDPSNYRPISLTCSINKILENIIHTNLETYLSEKGLIPKIQYGFNKNKSVTSQMVEAIDDWTNYLEHKHSIDIIYFDIRKAFDLINHSWLIQKLRNVGVNDSLLKWITNFLHNRTFSVKINQEFSEEYPSTCGVPQGSVLGPLLFNFYISDLEKELNLDLTDNNLTLKFFADDLKAYIHYKKSNQDLMQNKLQTFINKFNKYCSDNDLFIATEKCSVLYLGTKNPKKNYFINQDILPSVDNFVRDLGILITPKLKWETHIRHRCNLALAKFFNIFKIFKTNNPTILLKLYTTYVRPILESSFSVFNIENKNNKKLLENVQRKVTKCIFYRCYGNLYENPPPYEHRLSILKIQSLEMRKLKLDLVFYHKIILGEVKINVRNLPKTKAFRFSKRRNTNFIIPPAKSKLRFDSFFVRTCRLYTKLPPNLITLPNGLTFKNALKDEILIDLLVTDK